LLLTKEMVLVGVVMEVEMENELNCYGMKFGNRPRLNYGLPSRCQISTILKLEERIIAFVHRLIK